MSRLNRVESQARTRQQLVDTAKQLFLAAGFHATSLEKVADEAGYSKGAVYSNFSNKHQLCLAVLDRIHEEQAASMVAEFAGVTTVDEGVDALRRWAEKNIGNEDWTVLEVEFATASRNDEQVRSELSARRTAIRDTIAALLSEQAGRFDVRLPMSPQDAANLALSVGIGLGVQRAVDPSIPVTALTDVARLLLGGPPAK